MEYSYNLREGEEEIIDVYRGRTKLIVEFRVKFVVKGREEGKVVEVDLERYGVVVDRSDVHGPRGSMVLRLSDYRMPHDQVCQLITEALILLFGKGGDPPRGVVVDLVVSTLQLEGEDFNSALHRAMRPDYLLPLNHKYRYEVQRSSSISSSMQSWITSSTSISPLLPSQLIALTLMRMRMR